MKQCRINMNKLIGKGAKKFANHESMSYDTSTICKASATCIAVVCCVGFTQSIVFCYLFKRTIHANLVLVPPSNCNEQCLLV